MFTAMITFLIWKDKLPHFNKLLGWAMALDFFIAMALLGAIIIDMKSS